MPLLPPSHCCFLGNFLTFRTHPSSQFCSLIIASGQGGQASQGRMRVCGRLTRGWKRAPGVLHQGGCAQPPERWPLNSVPLSKNYWTANSLASGKQLSKSHWPLLKSLTVHGGKLTPQLGHAACHRLSPDCHCTCCLRSGFSTPPSCGPSTLCRHESAALGMGWPQVV